jgi:hypothetical protein
MAELVVAHPADGETLVPLSRGGILRAALRPADARFGCGRDR